MVLGFLTQKKICNKIIFLFLYIEYTKSFERVFLNFSWLSIITTCPHCFTISMKTKSVQYHIIYYISKWILNILCILWEKVVNHFSGKSIFIIILYLLRSVYTYMNVLYVFRWCRTHISFIHFLFKSKLQ